MGRVHVERGGAGREDERQDLTPASDAVQLRGKALDEQVQMLAPPDHWGPGGGSVHQAAALGTSGSSGPLPHLDTIQKSFGSHDVSQVQAHTDSAAQAGTAAMGADAFASGGSVAFASSSPTLHTAAHEAAHVVQQRGGVQLKGGVGQQGDRYEQHADQVADLVVQGKSAESLLSKYSGGSGGGASGVQQKSRAPVQMDKTVKSDSEDSSEDDESVGKISKPTIRKSSKVNLYQWTREGGFAKSGTMVAKGTKLKQARKLTIPDCKYAWVELDDGHTGYLKLSVIEVDTWGADKNPNHGDKHRLLESETGVPEVVNDLNREWFINQAVLMKAYRSLEGKDAETQKKLAHAMLQSFAKTAAHDPTVIAPALGIQFNPHLAGTATYHRSAGRTELLVVLRHLIAQDMGTSMRCLQVVSDPFIRQVLAREFPVFGRESAPDTKAHPELKVSTDIGSAEEFGTSIDALFRNVAGGRVPDNVFTFDVTRMFVATEASAKDMQAKVSRPLEAILLQKASAFVGEHEAKTDDTVKGVLEQIQLIAMTKHKGADVILVPPFLKFEGTELDDLHSEEEAALVKAVDQDKRGEFMAEGGHNYGDKTSKLSDAMIESGSRVDPLKARRLMLEYAESPAALQGMKKIMDLATGSTKTPTVAKDIATFMKMGTVSKFRDLSSVKDAPPYLAFYPVATYDLLAGLTECCEGEGGIDGVFEDKGITEVLQTSYYRILNAMAGASTFRYSMIEFLNNIELIHDQIQMILAIAEPHAPQVAFAKAIKARMKSADKDSKPTVPEGLDPKVHHKSSAMHSISSVLSGVEDQKEQDTGTRDLNALVLKDNYYESAGAVGHGRTFDVTVLDGYKLHKETAELDESMLSKKPKGAIDIFICDFHHNISVERSEYKLENIAHQVDQLYEKGLVADKFTVAIDCTVDFVKSEDVRLFLEKNKDRITGGQMNVVLYRSAQKFDMMGMDNYYGGFTVTINDGNSFDAFTSRISQEEDNADGLSHQGLAHLATYAGEHLDNYRKLIMANTKRLYDGLPGACKKEDSPLYVGKTEDPNNVFLDIQFPGRTDKWAFGDFYMHFIQWAHAEGLAFTTRPSFGFATTNFTLIMGSKVRLNPGLESVEAIAKYIGYFDRMQKLLAKTDEGAFEDKARGEYEKEELQAYLDGLAIAALKSWEVPKMPSKVEDTSMIGDGGFDFKPSSTAKKKGGPRRTLTDGADGELDIHSTVGDGSCGIHAALGALDPVTGQFRYANPAAKRASIAERIGAVDSGHNDEYNRVIASLLGQIDNLRAAKKGVSGDNQRLWAQFSQIPGIAAAMEEARQTEAHRVEQRNQSYASIVNRYLAAVKDGDAKYNALRDCLVEEISSSNAAGDAEAKLALGQAEGAAAKRELVRTMGDEYLKSAIAANLDSLLALLGGIDGMDGLSGDHTSYRDAPIPEHVFGAMVQGDSRRYRQAYGQALTSNSYYLLDVDLKVLADIENRALVIYRESDLNPGQYVAHTTYGAERGETMEVYHAGVHYERAQKRDG